MENENLEQLEFNLNSIQQRISKACERKGRDPSKVTLVAVTKKVEPAIAGMLINAGQDILGENRIQEAERKRNVLGDKGVWHMIGHLQRNKVKKAIPLFTMIHSVDSSRLLNEISKYSSKTDSCMEILFEVNISGEEAKFGMTPSDVIDAVIEAQDKPGVILRGLMTMAPYNPDPEAARPFFKGLKELMDKVKVSASAPENFDLLSMGMSGDYEVAVEEGATHIRVGTSLYKGMNL